MKKILLLIAIVALGSCNKNVLEDNDNQTVDNKPLVPNYAIFDSRATKYLSFFERTDAFFGVSAVKTTPLRDELVYTKIKSVENTSLKNITLNDMVFKEGRNNITNSTNLFGNQVHFKINGQSNQTNRGRNTTITFYSPKKIHITNPAVNNLDERLPLCDANNFVVEWNSDSQNTNGLYLAIRYNGMNIVGERSSNLERGVDYIESDNGRFTINPQMFSDIPNMALVEVILLRGNIEVATVNGQTVKVYTESHASINCILVKNRDKIMVQ